MEQHEDRHLAPAGPRLLISVIMPVYNGAATLDRALRSVHAQTFSEWEVVAVDDGSTDDTYAILQRWAKKDARIRVLRLDENRGPAAARNAALEIARGEWVTYLDHDDEFFADYLAQVAGHRDNAAEVLVFAYDMVTLDGRPIGTWDPVAGRDELFSTHIAMPMALAHRREVVEKAGAFNELLWWEEDAEFLRRLARAGARIRFVSRKSGRYCARADSRRRAPRATRQQKEVLHGNWREGKTLYGDLPLGTSRRKIQRVAFASPYCLMDYTSGAAIATANALRFLGQLGFDCRAFCGSYLDVQQDDLLEDMLTRQGSPHETRAVQIGQREARLIDTRHGTIPVTIFRSVSTRGSWQDEAEVAAFFEAFKAFLDENRPDAVWTYGGDGVTDTMVKLAKNRDIPVVFGLHNFGYWDIFNFAPVDYVTVPSEFSRQHHWAKLGLACHTLPNVIDWPRVAAAGREPRYVTFVNPQTTKGLFVFARIAEMLARRRPDIPLLVVEGRSHTAWREETGIDLGRLPSVKVMPSTGDPREFYAVTKLVLMPSLWNESFGLVAAEAMINGIPVLASNRGALPETVGDGGFLFDIPACYTPETRVVPLAGEVEPWAEMISRLWDDAGLYRQASETARRHAERWKPEQMAAVYRDFFGNLVPQPAPPLVPKNSFDPEPGVPVNRAVMD